MNLLSQIVIEIKLSWYWILYFSGNIRFGVSLTQNNVFYYNVCLYAYLYAVLERKLPYRFPTDVPYTYKLS